MERAAVDSDGSSGVAVDHALPSRIVPEAAGVHLQRSAVEGELSVGMYIDEVARVVVGRAEDGSLLVGAAVQHRQAAMIDHEHIAHGGFCGVHSQRVAVQVKLLLALDLQRLKDAHVAALTVTLMAGTRESSIVSVSKTEKIVLSFSHLYSPFNVF